MKNFVLLLLRGFFEIFLEFYQNHITLLSLYLELHQLNGLSIDWMLLLHLGTYSTHLVSKLILSDYSLQQQYMNSFITFRTIKQYLIL